MTTDRIEQLANAGGIAGPDLNVGALLRECVIPEFLNDCQYALWAQKTASETVLSGNRTFQLPADYGQMVWVRLEGDEEPLPFVGDDAKSVASSEEADPLYPGLPTGWYVKYLGGSGAYRNFCFDTYPGEDLVVTYAYRFRVPFSDDDNPVDLAPYIPERWHWALVEGLKREVYADRYGLGDPRYQVASEKFAEWKARALTNPEAGPGGEKMRFAR